MFAFAAGKSQGRSEETRAAERVSVCNGPESRLKRLSRRGSPTGRNLKNVETVAARGERRKGSHGAKGPRKEQGGNSQSERRHVDDT